ncbi:aminopeptidase [Saprospiraceae bacterium]|nr:aminopeptidase [Saprospiraceae bacterium]
MMLQKYAKLLVNYSLYLKKGEHLYISTSIIAEPLVKEVYREAIKVGAHVSVQFDFEDQQSIFYNEASNEQLNFIPPFHKMAMEKFDAYLFIRAPYSLTATDIDPEKRKIRSEALRPINKVYFDRTATGSMKRSLCQFPTEANAEVAGMTLEQYESFVFEACRLFEDDPQASWEQVSRDQQHIVDKLNKVETIRYKNNKSDISFSVKGRTWINSDGKTNMPSGEVFSSPVEDSVNGEIFFDFPSIYMGQAVEGITLTVKNGEVVKWHANVGQALLDKIMTIDGARYFGEVAIGTNYKIQRATKNILFDEKIGGSIHMALGQSYGQTGGKNQSSIHWDMICNMKVGGQIFADDILIYENGKFII